MAERTLPLLTRRQAEFLELTAQGLERSQIATQCFVAHTTVRGTLDDARERLGARTLAQAVAIAVELDLIEVDVSAYVVAA